MADLDLQAITDALASHASASGWFDSVNGHEPKNLPGKGLTAAVWLDRIMPTPGQSGLDSTSARVIMMVRIYTSMLSEPQDAIDPAVTRAVNSLYTAYSADFTLGDLVESVDLLGRHGVGMNGQAGYLRQDGRELRIFDITVPLILNDLWSQSA